MASILAIVSQLFGGGCRQSEYKPADIYVGLRSQLLKLTPDQIHFSPSPDNPKVLGMLMETGYPEAVATLVAVSDGAASLYFSSGGGIIGAGEHESPKVAAKELVRTAELFLGECKPTKEYPLPRKSYTRFYLVTTNGVLTAEVVENDLGNNKHELSPLFHKAHDLITQIRLIDEQRKTGAAK
jgi:hypothetical protein